MATVFDNEKQDWTTLPQDISAETYNEKLNKKYASVKRKDFAFDDYFNDAGISVIFGTNNSFLDALNAQGSKTLGRLVSIDNELANKSQSSSLIPKSSSDAYQQEPYKSIRTILIVLYHKTRALQ